MVFFKRMKNPVQLRATQATAVLLLQSTTQLKLRVNRCSPQTGDASNAHDLAVRTAREP